MLDLLIDIPQFRHREGLRNQRKSDLADLELDGASLSSSFGAGGAGSGDAADAGLGSLGSGGGGDFGGFGDFGDVASSAPVLTLDPDAPQLVTAEEIDLSDISSFAGAGSSLTSDFSEIGSSDVRSNNGSADSSSGAVLQAQNSPLEDEAFGNFGMPPSAPPAADEGA